MDGPQDTRGFSCLCLSSAETTHMCLAFAVGSGDQTHVSHLPGESILQTELSPQLPDTWILEVNVASSVSFLLHGSLCCNHMST